MTVTKTRAAWQGAVDLAALATSEAAAAVLVGMLHRWRVDVHPSTDVCAMITDVLKVQWREEAYICV